MAKAKLARSRSVKTVVWVRKPGPMAEVAMRKAAPTAARPGDARGCSTARECSPNALV